jgi:subtilisin family serine protease
LSVPGVIRVERNHKLGLLENYRVKDARIRAEIKRRILAGELPGGQEPAADNPPIPNTGSGGSGADPLFSKQWGMNQMGVQAAWGTTKGRPEIIVGVIDTGVDYTHEDLVDNMWHNPGEIADNGIDDDHNGYVDDIIGWDFPNNDNKPFDLTASMMDMLLSGGNPGHGTHCAGNVAARGENGKGISGVAPNVRIMALRFITEKGQGTTADAIKAIKYGTDMGARVLSNSWGSTGDDGGDESRALQDAINYSESKGVLFVAAAGNGDAQGVGYDNDTNAKPAFPATYTMESIVSVAAIDEAGNLGKFSNWGARSVDLAAPGVKVFSTVTQSAKYSDTVIDIPGLITATWDGTSMATPHVAGAAALYLSAHPEKTWRDAKAALLASVKKTGVLQGKVVSGGQLNVADLLRF